MLRRDDSLHFCGFGTQSGDNDKMLTSFGCDLSIVHNFWDIQRLCSDLGYVQQGLAQLASQVMGCRYVKDARVGWPLLCTFPMLGAVGGFLGQLWCTVHKACRLAAGDTQCMG